MSSRLWRGCVVFFVACALSSMSQAAASGPHQAVEQVTQQMMAVVKGGDQALKANPEQYYEKVGKVLDSVVSFEFIAKNVMGATWDQATVAQRSEFTQVFRAGMVKTLAKGMGNYQDLNIRVLPPKGEINGQKRVDVQQEVTGADKTHQISYSMALDKNNDWKLVNVVLNGVNLGKSFRDQFTQALKQNNNNIDAVTKGWNEAAK
ncbi:MAG TPA: ABC transporter substrate-binding protein [Cellvibrionaceae bacterium]